MVAGGPGKNSCNLFIFFYSFPAVFIAAFRNPPSNFAGSIFDMFRSAISSLPPELLRTKQTQDKLLSELTIFYWCISSCIIYLIMTTYYLLTQPPNPAIFPVWHRLVTCSPFPDAVTRVPEAVNQPDVKLNRSEYSCTQKPRRVQIYRKPSYWRSTVDLTI